MTRLAHAIVLSIGAVLSVGSVPPATAQDGTPEQVAVDWQDPEIAQFMQDKVANPPQSVTPADEAVLAQLKLPVLAFDRPPGLIARSFDVATAPKRQRQIVTDPENPVWYSIVDTFGDLTVSVDADLRIQQQLPANFPIYGAEGAAAFAPEVNVIERNVEEGMDGLIAEYTVYKFGKIAYRVTIQCTEATKAQCANSEALLEDAAALQLISARPPG